MNIRNKIIEKACKLIYRGNVHKLYKFRIDNRPVSSFKLVFFCGKNGINYLNASLISVHKKWKSIPELYIVTDGTPIDVIKSQLIAWPKKVDIILWEEAAKHFEKVGNPDLAEYGHRELWGKKFISILYCASKFPTFYSDTDILWFSNPDLQVPVISPVLKMAVDIEYCYSEPLLTSMGLISDYQHHPPLNAGLIFANGNFSALPNWMQLSKLLVEKPDNRTEQTSFAILNNFFNPNDFFTLDQVLIKLDDEFSLKYTGNNYRNLLARHYVNVKATTFWRDFMYMLMKK